MNTKPIHSLLVALCAAVLLLPLSAGAATSAFRPATIPHPGGGDTGNLYEDPTTFGEGAEIRITANFPSSAANELVTLYKETSPGNYTSTGRTDEANSRGNAYINDYQVDDDQKVFARAANGEFTEINVLNPVESNAHLDPITVSGADARATATFVPAQPGQSAALQVKSIKDGTWKTIDTDTQNSGGEASFYINDPLEVQHSYRAVSNGNVTNTVNFAGPLLDKNTGLPTVHFASDDGESVNTRTKWFDGEFTIKGGNGCSSVATFDTAEMRGRGNYSWTFEKKGFNLKFEDSKDLCGMGKSKKWALLANHYDRSLLRNSVANQVGKVFTNLEFTPKDKPVDLYVNGSYRGSYTLTERVNFEGGRLDEDELKYADNPADCQQPNITGSYLLEWDFRHEADHNFETSDRGWIGIKEPEDEDYCSAMGSYIRNYVENADSQLFDGSVTDDDWKQYIDVPSAVDYYIAMEYLKPVDGQMWASVYMYKPRGEKLHFGPLWDFDMAMGSANRAGNVVSPEGWYLRNPINVSARQSPKTWFNRLNEIPDFRAAVKARWNQIDQNLDEATSGFIATRRNVIDESAAENYQKWDHGKKISKYQVIKSSWSSDVNYLSEWLDDRKRWMNSQLDNAAG